MGSIARPVTLNYMGKQGRRLCWVVVGLGILLIIWSHNSGNRIDSRVDSMDLFPEQYEKEKLRTKKKLMKGKGNIWDFYRYYKQKKGFKDRDESIDREDHIEFSLVENF